ncbi:MAG: transketolase family protein [Oscillospiraceae bacterium]|nr:transketolase family protein [Oscillospiraceae bacterium]
MLDLVEMRAAYCEEMINLAKADDRIVTVESDLCRAAGMMKFKDEFPGRVFDVGVAEANMTGIAAGLAAMGKRPFIHTFAPFVTRRALDQIAVSIAYAGLPVKIIGSDAGIAAEFNGGTHMAFDDMGIMRAIPKMTVFEPADETALRALLPQMHALDTPCYMRLYRKKAEKVYEDGFDFKLGRCNLIKSGSDAVIIACGLVLPDCIAAANALDEDGIKTAVADMHTLKPLDLDFVSDALNKYKIIATAENHSVINGLGSAVSEYIAESGKAVAFKRIGVNDRFGEVGFKPYLQQALGLDRDNIAKIVKGLT